MAVMPQRVRDDCVVGLFRIMRKHAPLRFYTFHYIYPLYLRVLWMDDGLTCILLLIQISFVLRMQTL